jgi:phage repressor protein C with HTH and peptisase S24 domain
MKIGEILRKRREELGLTQSDVAAQIESDAGNISRIENGKQSIREAELFTLAKYLKLDMSFSPAASGVAQEGAAYILTPHALSPASQEVPIVGTTTGGTGGFWEELQYPTGHGDGYLDVPSKDPNAYALRVTGSSMSPRIYEGEVLLVEPNRACSPGDDVVVRTADGQVMVKVFMSKRDGRITLASIATDKRVVIDEHDIKAMHFVAGVFRPGAIKQH